MDTSFDRKFLSETQAIIAMDEVGRGPLAGPVTSCCVFLRSEEEAVLLAEIPYLDDSKKTSPKKRKQIAEWVLDRRIPFAIGVASVEEIDCENILRATEKSMERAVENLALPFSLALVDGNHLRLSFPHILIPKGDATSVRIALASNLAKYDRDSQMESYDNVDPRFGFAKHKGYGTARHLQAIRDYGATPFHRLTFAPLYRDTDLETLSEWRVSGAISLQRFESILKKKELMGDENGRSDTKET